MRIDKDKQLHVLDNLSKSSAAKGKKAAGISPQDAGGIKDKVELSGWKDEINRLKEKVKTMPAVNQEKVEEIKNGLKTETYNVKGELVARSLLKSHLLDEIL